MDMLVIAATPHSLRIRSVDAIVAIEDPAVRNLWITQTYADFGARLDRLIGGDHTWCSFATWASNTAGVSIRGAELPGFVEAILDGASPHIDAVGAAANDDHALLDHLGISHLVHRSHIDALAANSIAQVSEHIAHGNTLVFAELAPLFERFIAEMERRAEIAGSVVGLDDAAIGPLLDDLGVPSAGEEPLVRAAFERYAAAVGAEDTSRRAQLVLAANISAVLHEQQRLQRDVAQAIDACVVDVVGHLEAFTAHVVHVPSLHQALHHAIGRCAAPVEKIWEHLATALMMTLDVPGETLHLGRELPAPAGKPLFPAVLADITDVGLQILLEDWDPSGGTGRDCGAGDWANLRQRMGYIVNLFRSRQRCDSLAEMPFTAEQLSAIADDRLPAGL